MGMLIIRKFRLSIVFLAGVIVGVGLTLRETITVLLAFKKRLTVKCA